MWRHENIQRLLIDFSLKISARSFIGANDFYTKTGLDWKDDLGLDSIELMDLAAHANSFFCLFSRKDPVYLLSYTKLDNWVELIFEARKKDDTILQFQTSGTSGQSKTVLHQMSFLKREIDFLATLFKTSSQVIPYISSTSIYGFLFSIGLPHVLNIPVNYPSEISWPEMDVNSLIVSTPYHWQQLINALPEKVAPFQSVTSTSPMPKYLFEQIQQKNIRLTEIYGSTETGGVGFKTNGQNDFSLFPYWELKTLENGLAIEDKEMLLTYPLMDYLNPITKQTFIVKGRKDHQIKIAGKLVNLQNIQQVISALQNIGTCTISVKANAGEPLIQAEIRLLEDNETTRTIIKQQIRQAFEAHEIPRNIYFQNADTFN